jgi:phosphatidylserine/phosphatidylglycerophosphate/cardiolipin synthase-like enzyme
MAEPPKPPQPPQPPQPPVPPSPPTARVADASHEYWFLSKEEIDRARGGVGPRRTLEDFTSGNLVTPLIDGEDMMKALAKDLRSTNKGDFFHLMAWRLKISTELERAAKSSTANRLDNLLRESSKRGVRTRALIWAADITIPLVGPKRTRIYEEVYNDNKEAAPFINTLSLAEGVLDDRCPLMTVGSNQVNSGTHHQKAAVVQRDGEAVAYCGSIDIHDDTWDTQKHDSDPRRVNPDPLHPGGRHEVHLRVRGKAVLDIEHNFRDRWNEHEDPTEPPVVLPKHFNTTLPPVQKTPGTHHVQVLRTFACLSDPGKPNNHYRDFAPHGETTCLKGYLKAIGCAKNYIYIEDQYLISDEIAKALNKALDTIRKLILVVPQNPDENQLVVPSFNLHQEKFLQTVAHKDKVHVYELAQPKSDRSILVHSKVMIIDDIYAVVGSPNVSVRSMTHDSELAVAVVDETAKNGTGFARELRLSLWREHLELTKNDPISDPVKGVVEWDKQADAKKGRVRKHTTGQTQYEVPSWDAIEASGICAVAGSPTLFQSNFDATAVGQPPSPTQAVGAASFDGPRGSVLVVAVPPNAKPLGKWLQIKIPNQSHQVASFQGKLTKQPGNGTYAFSTALFIPPTGPQGEDNVATVSFEALAPQLSLPAEFLHLDFLSSNKVRIDDDSNTEFGKFPRNQGFLLDVTLVINATSAKAHIILSGAGASGEADRSVLSPLVQQAQQFGAASIRMGFPHTGTFFATNVLVQRKQ